ncbi:MAG: hypothetical protein F6K54_38850 [Okeania sp. SIO3B5]|nr:hypothetical protein [Okeania sp. SIO3B5]NEO58494.1 hypothetical protein [Okeania sp. SIO3B5]
MKYKKLCKYTNLPITPSPHHPITPSPHHSITPSPHHPITPSIFGRKH